MSEIKTFTVKLPDGNERIVQMSDKQRIGETLHRICEETGLPVEKYALTYKMTFLHDNSTVQDLVLPDGSELLLLEDFRPDNPEGAVNVVLKPGDLVREHLNRCYEHLDLMYRLAGDNRKVPFPHPEGRFFPVTPSQEFAVDCLPAVASSSIEVEGTHCSAMFDPDVSLWTVVKNLVASKVLSHEDATPYLIIDDDEYSGMMEMSQVTLLDAMGGFHHHLHCRFKMSAGRNPPQNAASTMSALSIYDGVSRCSISKAGYESSASSNVDEKGVTFRQTVEYYDPVEHVEERTGTLFRKGTQFGSRSKCCPIL